ncbi:MAG: hypothetical protein M3492_05075, partial [Actinomycetota bacterium]|nr:hypothetical protein [Actinomycetota bacterium]
TNHEPWQGCGRIARSGIKLVPFVDQTDARYATGLGTSPACVFSMASFSRPISLKDESVLTT